MRGQEGKVWYKVSVRVERRGWEGCEVREVWRSVCVEGGIAGEYLYINMYV